MYEETKLYYMVFNTEIGTNYWIIRVLPRT